MTPRDDPHRHSLEALMTRLADIAAGEGDAPLDHAMPGAFYTSPAFLDIERDAVFRRQWICLGHAGEVPDPGDYFATELVGEPLLVVRDDDRQVRVMANVCRHRGNVVASGRGNKRFHVCGYHAWSYQLDGRLRHAPMMESCPRLDPASCRLPPIRSELWHNFIFVNLDGGAAPLAPSLRPLETHIGGYHDEDRHLYHVREETWRTNWKCLAENFMEGYHLNATHPRTLRPVTPTELCEYVPGNGAFSAYISHYTESAPQRVPFHPGLSPEARRYSFLFSVFPSFVITVMPHQSIYLCLRPVSVNEVALRWGITGHEPALSPEALKRAVDFADAFNAEDRVKLESLQVGLASSFYEPGPLAATDLEGTLRDFYRFMARSIVR